MFKIRRCEGDLNTLVNLAREYMTHCEAKDIAVCVTGPGLKELVHRRIPPVSIFDVTNGRCVGGRVLLIYDTGGVSQQWIRSQVLVMLTVSRDYYIETVVVEPVQGGHNV